MKILQERGFFGAGLVPVTTPLLVDRYNDCLKAIGKEPTERKRFAIDGAGWSPQIAAERNDPNYLCHGEANLYAVLLTPEQKGKPVYMPMHSFDWKILDSIHTDHRRALHNLTGISGVILDIDQGIDAYHGPFDLLMLHSIVVRPSTPGHIMRKTREQRELVARFRHEEDAYSNRVLVEKLVSSARENGDLRHQALFIPEAPFDEVNNFYTRAMGGIFVFRSCPKREKPILIAESGEMAKDPNGRHDLYSLKEEPSVVLKMLEEAGLVRRLTGLSEEDRNRRLSIVIEALQTRAIYDSGFREDLGTLTAAQRKGAFVSAQEFLPDYYKELYELKRLIDIEARPPKLRLSTAAKEATLVPAPGLDSLTTDIVWQLLSLINPLDLEMTFRHSKQQFYRLYQNWGPGQRKWAIHQLESRGLPQSDRF